MKSIQEFLEVWKKAGKHRRYTIVLGDGSSIYVSKHEVFDYLEEVPTNVNFFLKGEWIASIPLASIKEVMA
jgi:hypothetical protein